MMPQDSLVVFRRILAADIHESCSLPEAKSACGLSAKAFRNEFRGFDAES